MQQQVPSSAACSERSLAAAMEVVRASLGRVRCPTQHDAVFKDECLLCFDTPESPDGLYVCLQRFVGLGRRHLPAYHAKTGAAVFLNTKRRKGGAARLRRRRREERVGGIATLAKLATRALPIEDATFQKKPLSTGESEAVPEKITRLAIGVEGGAQDKKHEYEEENCIVVMPGFRTIALTCTELPLAVQLSVAGVLTADSASRKSELEAAAGTWDGEKLELSKFADGLQQLDNGVQIPPRGWRCAHTDCDKTDNLWLNLTDGSILCGRRQYDGSGGNNHAFDEYQKTKHPLAVKLGTITKDGKADVFSYAEDSMVLDPRLPAHLSHFGINVADMIKTDKTMVEIEIDYNQRIGEWATLTESGTKLTPLFGPGYTGLQNLGNSCYMNSVMQVLFTLPTFAARFAGQAAEDTIAAVDFSAGGGGNLSEDFGVQLTKLGAALVSGRYSLPVPPEGPDGDETQAGIRPTMFKNLIGKGNAEFSSKSQQDAQEYLGHFLNRLETHCQRSGQNSPAECIKFDVEDRIACGASGRVRYRSRVEDVLPLPIPLDAAVNAAEVEEYKAKKAAAEAKGEKLSESEPVVRPRVSFEACLSKFAAAEEITHANNVPATKTMRLKTFPDYLIIQMLKFDVGRDWVPYKMDVSVPMPDELDLTALAAGGPGGLKPGEEPMSDDEDAAPPAAPAAAAPAAAAVVPDQAIVSQVMGMGFSAEAGKKAAFHTKNSGYEAAVAWVLEHMEDADFNAPFVAPGAAAATGGTTAANANKFVANESGIEMLCALGCSRAQAVKALRNSANDTEAAANWYFNHMDDPGEEEQPAAAAADEPPPPPAQQTSAKLTTGAPKYALSAFISHMGTSHTCGHYVAHIRKGDDAAQWAIFNDEKVAKSENPPKDLGYLYLYKRQGLP